MEVLGNIDRHMGYIQMEPLHIKLTLLNCVVKCLIGFRAILQRMTFSVTEVPFCVKFCFSVGMTRFFLPGFRSQRRENEYRYFHAVSAKMFAVSRDKNYTF